MPISLRPRLYGVLFMLFLVVSTAAIPAQSGRAQTLAKKVLILNSYHPGLIWSDEEMKGVRSALPADVDVSIEYMDAKRVASPVYMMHLDQIYSIKYMAQPPDIIITLDDDAFQFAMKHHRNLFAGIPIVFGGVNNFDPVMTGGDPLVTGVVEQIDIAASIELAIQQNPEADRLYLVTDNTTTGMVNRSILEKLASSGAYQPEFIFLVPEGGVRLEGLLSMLRAIPEKKSIVYYADFFQERDGNVLNPEVVMPLVSQAAAGPVYVHAEMYVGYGAVGGKVISSKTHGSTVGALAARILAGEPVQDIPIIEHGTNTYMFDQRQLTRWDIPNAALPEDSQVLFRPAGLLEVIAKNRLLLTGVLAFVIFQALMISFLGWNLHRLNAARNALRLSEERWQFALTGSGDGVWDWDMDKNEVAFSPRYVEMLGYTNGEFGEGLDAWASRVHPEDLNHVLADLQKHVRGEKTASSIEFRMRAKDGAYLWIHGRGKIIASAENGTPLRMVGTHTDITQRKQDEEKIRQLNATLEQRVAERTKQLETANQELEAFSYSVSHDLRVPLRSIDGLSQIMQEDYQGVLPEEALECLSSIRDSSQHMAELIEALLGLSQVTRADLNRVLVNLSDFAREISEKLTQRDPQRVVSWNIPDTLTACADPLLTRILLTNLLENAWKFTSSHPTATITLGAQKLQGERVYFVRDDGAGFDMAYASRLFGAFQRLHAASDFEGTGIGLATVQRIVHRHGGNVWAEGVPEQGATIYFTLPD